VLFSRSDEGELWPKGGRQPLTSPLYGKVLLIQLETVYTREQHGVPYCVFIPVGSRGGACQKGERVYIEKEIGGAEPVQRQGRCLHPDDFEIVWLMVN